jgi:hypothetical protein
VTPKIRSRKDGAAVPLDEFDKRLLNQMQGSFPIVPRPTYGDWPYQLFTMAHGRSKEECDAILDAVEREVGCVEQRATLYSSTEFKKVRLLYFTEAFKDWEREHAGV